MTGRPMVQYSRHLNKNDSVSKVTWMVTLALLPAGVIGVYLFGLSALKVIILGTITAVVAEAALQIAFKEKVTVLDGSAFLTGLLLAYNLPAHVPF